MKTSELIQLVKDVFGTELGKSLMQQIEDELSTPSLFDADTHRMYTKVGQIDLIRRWKYYINMPAKDFERIVLAEKENTLLNHETTDLGDLLND